MQRLRWAVGANPSLNLVLQQFEDATSMRKHQGEVGIIPLLGHCIAKLSAINGMSGYLVKLTVFETSWGRGDTVT